MNDDPYKNIISDNWDVIMKAYNDFKKFKPIIEFDIFQNKIMSCPADEYIEELSQRTRANTKKLYQKVCKNNEIMIFIRDTKNKKLKSYIYNLD